MFQDNQHRMTLVMTPTKDFEAKRQKQEAEMLQSYVEKLSADDKKSIYEKGMQVK